MGAPCGRGASHASYAQQKKRERERENNPCITALAKERERELILAPPPRPREPRTKMAQKVLESNLGSRCPGPAECNLTIKYYRRERCGTSENHATNKENYKTMDSRSVLF